MATALQNSLLIGLLLVAAVHTRSRLAGAFAACVWCAGALAFGALAFQTRPSIVFLGITVPPWIYFAFMGGLLLFNVGVIVRAFRRRTARPLPAAAAAAAAASSPERDTGRGPAGS